MSARKRVERRGQGTLEYILIISAILIACIVAANSVMTPAVKGTFNKSKAAIENGHTHLVTGMGLDKP